MDSPKLYIISTSLSIYCLVKIYHETTKVRIWQYIYLCYMSTYLYQNITYSQLNIKMIFNISTIILSIQVYSTGYGVLLST